MRIKVKVHEKGVTLIEIIISMAILAIIVAPLFSLTLSTFKTSIEAQDKLEAKNIAQKYMEIIQNPNTSFDGIYSSIPSKENNFTIEKSKIDVTSSNVTSTNEVKDSSDIKYNYKIVIDTSGNLNIYDNKKNLLKTLIGELTEGRDMELVLINSNGNFSIKNDSNKYSHITSGTSDLSVLVDNQFKCNVNITASNGYSNIDSIDDVISEDEATLDTTMILYFINSGYGDINLTNSYGNIKVYNNIADKIKNTKLYKIIIKIKKDGKVLQTVEGYRTSIE